MKQKYVICVYQFVNGSPVWKCGNIVKSTSMPNAIKIYEKLSCNYSEMNPYLDLVTRYPKELFMLGISTKP